MLLALLSFPVFMAVWAMKNNASTAYETCVTAAFKPLKVILPIRVDSLEFSLSTELLAYRTS
jgi:hypothetical protein